MGNLFGGGARAAKKAGALQQQAGNQAAQLALDTQKGNVALAQPRLDFSNGAMSRLNDLLGINGGDAQAGMAAVQASPGYQFRLNEGQRQMDGSAAARGLLFSGKSLLDSQDFGQRIANDARQTEIGNLGGIYDSGNGILSAIMGGNSNAAANAGNFRVGGANAMGQGMVAAADKRAAGINEAIKFASQAAQVLASGGTGAGQTLAKWGF